MASAAEVATVDGLMPAEKTEFQSSSTNLSKTKYALNNVEDGNEIYDQANPARPGFTKFDQKDMWRMGRVQEFKRNYRPLAALSFASVLTAVWEYLLMANTQGMIDGGLAGLFWAYVWNFVGFSFVVLSLAEMASMAPISGGQYHWVSEFAPLKYQKFLSYVIGLTTVRGWMSTLSWQAGNASGSFLTGTIVQALLVINYPDYNPTAWQGTLFVFAMVLVLFIVNIWGAPIWAVIQNGLMFLHIAFFLVIIIILWVRAPHQNTKTVFTQFSNDGGWSSMGLSVLVGQITAIYSLLGSDATAHIAEEVRDAGLYVPISIFWSYIVNGIMAIIFLITYLFAVVSVEDALNDPSGYPFIYVFSQAMSTRGVTAVTIIVLLIVIAANISWNASTARQTLAFARDNGLPFSKWISHVSATKEIPVNSIILTCVITCLLSLINIGSATAFNAIISLQVCAIMLTYTVSVGCVLYRRIVHPELLPVARWSLGKYGVAVNSIGVCYCSFVFFWSFWPNEIPVNAQNFNWSVVLFLGVLGISLIMYVLEGRRLYKGPVTIIRATRVD